MEEKCCWKFLKHKYWLMFLLVLEPCYVIGTFWLFYMDVYHNKEARQIPLAIFLYMMGFVALYGLRITALSTNLFCKVVNNWTIFIYIFGISAEFILRSFFLNQLNEEPYHRICRYFLYFFDIPWNIFVAFSIECMVKMHNRLVQE